MANCYKQAVFQAVVLPRIGVALERQVHGFEIMMGVDPADRGEEPLLEETSTKELAERALGATKKLIQAEIGLAKEEISEQLRSTVNAIAVGLAAFAALVLSLAALMMVIVLTSDAPVRVAVGFALALVLASLVAAVFAYRAWPKEPLVRTRKRLTRETEILGRGAL